jgi:FtsZ-binding cell division protein ZapB
MKNNKTVSIEAEFQMTEDEKTYAARESVRLTDELDRMAEEFKDSRADWRKRIKDIKTKRDDLNKAFMVGMEKRKLDCIQNIDLDSKKARYLFDGKVVSERDLTLDELAEYGTAPLFTEDELDQEANELRQIISQETSHAKHDLVTV